MKAFSFLLLMGLLLAPSACAEDSRIGAEGRLPLSAYLSDSEMPAGEEDERLVACALILGTFVPLEECLLDTLPEFFSYVADYRECDAYFLPSYGREEHIYWSEDDYSVFAQVLLINRQVFADGTVSQEEVRSMILPRPRVEVCESHHVRLKSTRPDALASGRISFFIFLFLLGDRCCCFSFFRRLFCFISLLLKIKGEFLAFHRDSYLAACKHTF